MDNVLSDFQPGQRIKMHPCTDLFMRGAVWGDVVSVGRKYVTVQLDELRKRVKVHPSNLLTV